MEIQALIDGMSAQWQRERSDTQMTLGGIIDLLQKMPEDFELEGFGNPHSYRGYYCDLAFEKIEGTVNASDAIRICKEAMGEVFTGYKGGDYMMGRLTPIWVADYGCCGEKIMGFDDCGRLITQLDD